MGFQIRWWKNFGPFRINLSRTGPTISLGGKSGRVNVGKKGVRTTARIPGQGTSWTRAFGWKRLFGKK